MLLHHISATPEGRHAQTAIDIVAGGVTLSTIAGVLPSIAAIGAIIWYSLTIYDWVAAKLAKRRVSRDD